jgi:hypothetical protein
MRDFVTAQAIKSQAIAKIDIGTSRKIAGKIDRRPGPKYENPVYIGRKFKNDRLG